MNIEKFKLRIPGKFETLKDIPEFPKVESKEELQQLIKIYKDAGAISKKDLIPGGWYLGQSRSTSVARWFPSGFSFIRKKMWGDYVDEIPHFEDDKGHDVFVPFKLLYSDREEF